DESRIDAHPEATIPSTNSRHLPAPYQKVERRRNVSAKAFASPEGKFIDAIESDPVRRDGGVVEVDEPPPLVVGEVWFTEQFDILWYGRTATLVKKPVSAATIDRGVPCGEAAWIRRSEGAHIGKTTESSFHCHTSGGVPLGPNGRGKYRYGLSQSIPTLALPAID